MFIIITILIEIVIVVINLFNAAKLNFVSQVPYNCIYIISNNGISLRYNNNFKLMSTELFCTKVGTSR